MRIHKALLPVSWLYGLGVVTRNLLFDCGLLKSRSFDIPVICVGNLAVGGTGKTPHVEHLVRLLKERCKVAVLSRGYKRRTKGFVLADDRSTALDIGDEPMQIHRKFSDIIVAVDEDRCEGIERLVALGAEVVLLDDAFQHRYVKPSLSILLMEYDRLKGDRLMPAGRLREPLRGMRRADIVVVTKCPDRMQDGEYKEAERHLSHRSPKEKALPSQKLFFSRMAYKSLKPVFPEKGDTPPTIDAGTHVLFNKAFAQLPEPRLLVTTEKDAARLRTTKGLSTEAAAHACLIPIQVELLRNEQDAFDQAIITHISKKMLASGFHSSDKQ